MKHVRDLLALVTVLTVGINANAAQLPPPSNPPASVTLAWDPVAEAGSYKVYYGVGSRNYTNFVSVTNALQVTIQPLTRGTTYYFAATTVSTNGLESDWSVEVSYKPGVAPQPPVLRLVLSSGSIQGTGSPFESYSIERTEDFTSWESIGGTKADALGEFTFTDTNPPRLVAFYRTVSETALSETTL